MGRELDADKTAEWLLAAGREVDHFRVMRSLGRGGMAEVYLARDSTRAAMTLFPPIASGLVGL